MFILFHIKSQYTCVFLFTACDIIYYNVNVILLRIALARKRMIQTYCFTISVHRYPLVPANIIFLLVDIYSLPLQANKNLFHTSPFLVVGNIM